MRRNHGQKGLSNFPYFNAVTEIGRGLGGFGLGVLLSLAALPQKSMLPQKSCRSVIPFADHDPSAAISEFVLCWPPCFSLVGLLVGLKSSFGWFLFDL